MKKLLFLILLVNTGLLTGHAQSDATISGLVIDKDTKEKIPFATISVTTEDNQLINGSITSDDGRFTIRGLNQGTFTITVSFIGYTSFSKEILIGALNRNFDLGRIEIEKSSIDLEEVTVTGNKSELSTGLDKKSYDMSKTIAQTGGSIMDAMKAMPGISFDQEGKIILRGSDKVIVLIDGKQSSLTGIGNQKGLDNIPVANVEQIEIINNPSAKYDANGMAGIINIIYKKETQKGLHGNIGFAYGTGALTKRKNDLPTEMGSFSPTPKYIPSFDLNYKKEKVNMFLQSEVMIQKRLPNNEFTTRHYDDGRAIASQVPENRKQTHLIFKGGIDYYLNERNTLTFSGVYDWESHVDSAQIAYINLADGIKNRFITWNEEEITGYMNLSFFYEHKFNQPGHTLQSHIQYTKGWEDETYYINDSSYIRDNGRDVTHVLGTEHTTTVNFDYTKPLLAGRIETGSKLQIRNLPVEYDQVRDVNTMLYEGLGSWTKWGESIYSAYINLVHEKTRYDVEGGIRTEYTSVFYDMDEENIYYSRDDKYNYFKLFPSIRLSLNLNRNNKISLFFNQRIDRPGEPELRMYAKSDDHELVKVGNPYLRPQYTKSAEIGYKTFWKGGSVFVSGFFRTITDPYMRVYTQDTSNTDFDVVLKSYANTGESNNLGLEVILSQQINSYWKLSGNLNFYQNKIKNYEGNLLFPYAHTFYIEETTDNTWDIKIINTLDIQNNFQFQLTGIYFAPKNIPLGKQYARSSVDIGIKKNLWEGKGEISLAATDIFNRFGTKEKIYGDGFYALYENYYETQVIRIGFKYKF